jgi:hypothetical protein
LVQLQTILLFSNNFIGKLEFTFFRKLTHLSILDLSDNDLVVVDGANDSSLASLSKLNYLSLSRCRICKYPNFLRHQDQIAWIKSPGLTFHITKSMGLYPSGHGRVFQIFLQL